METKPDFREISKSVEIFYSTDPLTGYACTNLWDNEGLNWLLALSKCTLCENTYILTFRYRVFMFS